LLHERKDILNYTVFTLDIEQRASTTILSISGLPNDLYEVVPLPLPVGGALLLGANDLVHVDEAGKTNAIALNEFAKSISSFAMIDQSDLGLRLENCTVQPLGDNGDMLIILTTGQLAILNFTLEGRSVSGLQLHQVAADHGGSILPTGASCACTMSKGRIFLGSEDSDAVLLGWSRKTPQLVRKRSHAEMLGEEAEVSFDDADLDDDDDIYGDDDSSTKQQGRTTVSDISNPTDYSFRKHSTLPNYAPIGELTLGDSVTSPKGSKGKQGPANPMSELELLYPTGRCSAGGLAILKREIDPVVTSQTNLPNTKAIWGVRPIYDLAANAEFDEYIVSSRTSDEGSEESALYKITPKGLEPAQKDDFDPEAGATIEVGTVAGGTKIVQILKEEVKCYDAGKCTSHSSLVSSVRCNNTYGEKRLVISLNKKCPRPSYHLRLNLCKQNTPLSSMGGYTIYPLTRSMILCQMVVA
jgi:cleavage and polyadenylation specificity factor subunit 1